MSPLTKVLVILTTFLSIVYVTLTVPFLAKVEDQKENIADLQNRLNSAELAAKINTADLEEYYSDIIEQRQKLQSQVTQLQSQITDLKTAKDKAEQDLIAKTNDMTALLGQYTRLAAAETKNSQLLETISNNLQDAQQSNQQMKTRQVELENRIAELESERDSYKAEARFVKERLSFVTEQYNELKANWDRVPVEIRGNITGEQRTATVPPKPANPIPGEVTRVERVDGTTYLQINVGTADGVKDGMEFKVHRDGNFLARLTVDKADVDASAGRISLVQGEIEVGDDVVAE